MDFSIDATSFAVASMLSRLPDRQLLLKRVNSVAGRAPVGMTTQLRSDVLMHLLTANRHGKYGIARIKAS